MGIMLDTSIQIDRLYGSSNRRIRIMKVLGNSECYTSSYVLGEYCSNMVNTYCTMISIILQENDLSEISLRITEKAFGRDKDRVVKVWEDIKRTYDCNLAQIKEAVEDYPRRMMKRFFWGINNELVDETQCHRAKGHIEIVHGVPIMKDIFCTKKDDQCSIETFWVKYKHYFDNYNDKSIMQMLKDETFKGDACRDLGDCIICLETLEDDEKTVCSTNRAHFQQICKHIGIELLCPDYSSGKSLGL